MTEETRTYRVEMLTRVEGEGRFELSVRGGEVVSASLTIFEAPRYFEAFLRGRSLYEVPDIVARICGICPVAYQMSAVQALDGAVGVAPPASIRALRRLLYCGEWIESHALHVFLLHAPDFLGYGSAIDMAAAGHRAVVERGLAMKKAGNALLELLGGRAIHPISVRVGGFTKAPTPAALRALRPTLAAALEEALATVGWAAALPTPEFETDYVLVAVDSGADYPMEGAEAILVSGQAPVPLEAFEEVFEESHVERSNALHCRLRDGRAYLTGPIARLNLTPERLHPKAQEALEASGLALPVTNPYRSIVVRAVELVHAFAEALDIIDAYTAPPAPYLDGPVVAGVYFGATEAPRGLLWHRYEIGADGLVADARIVPPTSQNQARIEQDLVELAPEILPLSHEDATHRCEQLIRAYDPCISCATHFLRLDIERL